MGNDNSSESKFDIQFYENNKYAVVRPQHYLGYGAFVELIRDPINFSDRVYKIDLFMSSGVSYLDELHSWFDNGYYNFLDGLEFNKSLTPVEKLRARRVMAAVGVRTHIRCQQLISHINRHYIGVWDRYNHKFENFDDLNYPETTKEIETNPKLGETAIE